MATPSISKFTFLDLYFLDFQWDVYSLFNDDVSLADTVGRSYRGFNPLKTGIAPGGQNNEPSLNFSNQYTSQFRFAGLPLSSGIRDVQGVNNNLLAPYTGGGLSLFERLFPAEYIVKIGATAGGFGFGTPNTGNYGPVYPPIYDPALTIDYKTRGTVVIDAQPRIISNLVDRTPTTINGVSFDERDNPRANEWISLGGTQPGLRVSPLTLGMNPMAASSWMTLFGQFFDHGLDFIAKGKDGTVYMPVLPGDPLYDNQTSNPKNSAVLAQGRSNTVRVEIGKGSTDALLTDFALSEFVDPGRATLSDPAPSAVLESYGLKTSATDRYEIDEFGNPVSPAKLANGNSKATVGGGTFVLNGLALNIPAGSTWNQVVAIINGVKKSTGITALFGGGKLTLLPVEGSLATSPLFADGESVNRVSGFVDLSQSYGSVDSLTILLKDYGGTTLAPVATGKLLNKAGAGDTMPDWATIKSSALSKLGLTLHDYNVSEVPLIEKVGTAYKFVALNALTGAKVYLTDTADLSIQDGTNVLLGTGVAFLDDIAPGQQGSLAIALSQLNVTTNNGDLLSGTNQDLLNIHYVGGDGRANENIGLTAIHQVFHTMHNQIADKIKADWGGLTAAQQAALGGTSPSGDELFEKAKLVTEMQYQHHVFAEFARKLSPNVGAFAAFSPLISAGISLEFSQGVYRLGHSQVTETIDLQAFNPTTGLAISGALDQAPLLKLFLNPGAFNGETTAGQVGLGMANQVQYQIDQYINDTLQSNLLGLGLDLGAFNIMRGRDEGLPSLNKMRTDISKWLEINVVPGLLASPTNPSAAALLATINNLRPYGSWQDFADHLLVAGTAKTFIMAYARDAILSQYGGQAADFDWNGYQLTNPTGYQNTLNDAATQALADPTFMGDSYTGSATPSGNQDFNNIDLWPGGLAEAKTPGGMLGPVFDFIFALQMAKLQDGDRFYYLGRVAGTDFFPEEVDSRLFADLVMEATGTRHMYLDIMTVNDSDVEISSPTFTKNPAITTPAQLGNSAGWVNTGTNGNPIYSFYGNPGTYTDATGKASPNGAGNSSEMLGGTDAAERINAGGGNDTVWCDGGNDDVNGGPGADFLDGGLGADLMHGGADNDFMRGGDGNDQMFGDLGDDIMHGQAGNDTAFGGDGADAISGEDGADLLYGGNNVVAANGLRDATDLANVISGGRGNDTCYGGGGADAIDGGVDADLLIGGGGADAIACGLDNAVDTVWFNEPLVNGVIDTITQFTVAEAQGGAPGYVNDILRFSRTALPQTVTNGGANGRGQNQITTTNAPPMGPLAASQFETMSNTTAVTAPVGTTALIRFIYNTTNGALWYDQDGSGAVPAIQVATLGAYDPLNPNDPGARPPLLAATNVVIV